MKRRIGFLAAAFVAALVLAGCGSSNDGSGAGSGGSSGSDFNDADVTFAQSMIPHHEQAVDMAKMAQAQAASPKVKSLASKIEAAQGPEIKTMEGWLHDWGKDGSSGSMGGMDHGSDSMDHGSDSMDMPGMMSDRDMSKLESATGTEFDRMFLTMMVQHHQGAIEMAKTVQSDGKNQAAKALAKKIEADQTAEIAKMKRMLAS